MHVEKNNLKILFGGYKMHAYCGYYRLKDLHIKFKQLFLKTIGLLNQYPFVMHTSVHVCTKERTCSYKKIIP